MTIKITDTISLQQELAQTITRLLTLVNSFDADAINTVPFTGSWTAAQVGDHITRSNLSIAKALELEGSQVDRDPGERIKELKKIFLDFDQKLNAPPFILPTQEVYDKNILVVRLERSAEKIKSLAEKAELSATINHPAFGDITKYEILHFVIYHTQRHIHQLENIFKAIHKSQSI